MAESAVKPDAGKSGEKEKRWDLQDGHSHRMIAMELEVKDEEHSRLTDDLRRCSISLQGCQLDLVSFGGWCFTHDRCNGDCETTNSPFSQSMP